MKSITCLAACVPLVLCVSVARASEAGTVLEGRLPAPTTTAAGQLGPASGLLPFRFNLRLGLMVSPRTGFVPGVDVTIPLLRVLPGFTSRVSADAIITSKPGGTFSFSAFYPVTFDQVYSKGLVTGQRIYGGVGFGPYISEVTRIGGKVFVGANITGSLGAEATLHFAGVPDPLFTIQARIGL